MTIAMFAQVAQKTKQSVLEVQVTSSTELPAAKPSGNRLYNITLDRNSKTSFLIGFKFRLTIPRIYKKNQETRLTAKISLALNSRSSMRRIYFYYIICLPMTNNRYAKGSLKNVTYNKSHDLFEQLNSGLRPTRNKIIKSYD